MSEHERKISFAEYVLKVTARKPFIAVIGGGRCSGDVYELAEEVGKEIAIREGIVICGGLSGVMEACCKGAKRAGGLTIGILPGISIDNANEYVDLPIATGMGMARNAVIAHTGRVAIAVDGKFGTLSEIGFCRQLYKPVIGIKTWNIPSIISVEHPIDAVEKAFSLIYS